MGDGGGKVGNDVLGCSAARGMRQTFSCLSKFEGTTNLIRLLFVYFELLWSLNASFAGHPVCGKMSGI